VVTNAPPADLRLETYLSQNARVTRLAVRGLIRRRLSPRSRFSVPDPALGGHRISASSWTISIRVIPMCPLLGEDSHSGLARRRTMSKCRSTTTLSALRDGIGTATH